MKLNTLLSKSEDTCRYTLSPQHRSTHAPNLNECQHMQILSQPLILAHTYSIMLSPQYNPTHAGICPALNMSKHLLLTRSALDMRQHVKISLTRADTWWNMLCSYIWRYTPSSRYVQTHANTRWALRTNKTMQINAQICIKEKKNANSCPSPWYKPINAGTLYVQILAIVCKYIHSPWCLQTQADIWPALNACKCMCQVLSRCINMQTHAKPSIHDNIMKIPTLLRVHVNQCRYMLAFDTGQVMLVHAELLIPAKTCTCTPGSRIVKTHANTRSALNTGQHMRNHDWISTSAETCTIMLSSWYWPTHDDITSSLRYEPTHAGLLIHAETCVHTLSSRCWPKYKDTRSALDKCRNMQKDARLSTHADTCRHTLSSWYVPALNVCRHMLRHARLSKRATTRRYTLGSWYVQAHACTRSILCTGERIKTHTHPVLNMCRHMHTHGQLSRHMQIRAHLSTQETECRCTFSSWNMPTNAQLGKRHKLSMWRYMLSSRHGKLSEDTRSALETCSQMLSSQGTCRRHMLSMRRYTLSSWHRKLNEDTRSALDKGNTKMLPTAARKAKAACQKNKGSHSCMNSSTWPSPKWMKQGHGLHHYRKQVQPKSRK
jgi:hypothetical protein